MTSCHRCKRWMTTPISVARIACICSSRWVKRLRIGRITSNLFITTPKATPSKKTSFNIRRRAPLRSATTRLPRALGRCSSAKRAIRHPTPSSFSGYRAPARRCLSRFSHHTAWSMARWSYPTCCRSAASSAGWVSERAIINILSIWQVCLRSNSPHWARSTSAIHRCTGWARPSSSTRCQITSATLGSLS